MNVHVTKIHDLFDQFTTMLNGDVQQRDWEQYVAIPEHIGSGHVTRSQIRPGMEIMITDVTFKQDMLLTIQECCELFELSYCVSGEINCEWNGKSSQTLAHTGNVLFLKDVQVYEQKKAGVRNHLLEVRFAPEQLLRYAESQAETQKMESWLSHHRGNIDAYPNSPAIVQCVTEMLHCPHFGAMKRLYLEGKSLELIALFGESDGYGSMDGRMQLHRSDLSKLHHAHALVQMHFEQPLSIRELSKQIGMNEVKLKKGFRQLFGMTIFELVRKKRMEKALWYLEVAHLNVGEAAVSVGYSNASNFTTNFRKHYGCNPSDYMKLHKKKPLSPI